MTGNEPASAALGRRNKRSDSSGDKARPGLSPLPASGFTSSAKRFHCPSAFRILQSSFVSKFNVLGLLSSRVLPDTCES
jgi:hypothetical protein